MNAILGNNRHNQLTKFKGGKILWKQIICLRKPVLVNIKDSM